MANWAIVIGIDRYWSPTTHLHGAVHDALKMREWLLDPNGGNVPKSNLQLVLSPREDDKSVDLEELRAAAGTKSNIIIAINNLMALSGGKGERLFFYFAGHGLTARVSNRDESAILATDFTTITTDQSLALRSLWEFFETTQFLDQFLFVDACRNVPPWGQGSEFEIGRWTLPRSREPGAPPVQQFILYATSPKDPAIEKREPGAEYGAFTKALLDGLRGDRAAKAWSWDRARYEVRWERLADYVKQAVVEQALPVRETPEGKDIQIPQDTGSRGVADRERDALLTSFAAGVFPQQRLEVFLDPKTAYPKADVRVLNALGDVVAGQVGVAGESVVFYLPPGTYALRAAEPEIGEGRITSPVELYAPLLSSPTIKLEPATAAPLVAPGPLPAPDGEPRVPAEAPEPPPNAPPPAAARSAGSVVEGRVPLEAADPLSIVEVRDETGRAVEVEHNAGQSRGLCLSPSELRLTPGFYKIRHIGPETASEPIPVALSAGETETPVVLQGAELSRATRELLTQMGGEEGDGHTVRLAGCEPIAWAETSTLVALALGRALEGTAGDPALGIEPPRPEKTMEKYGGIAVYLVSEAGPINPDTIEVRVWRAGEPVPKAAAELDVLGDRLVAHTTTGEPGLYWVSVHRERQGRNMVFALTVLDHCAATIVLQLTKGIRIFQYQPTITGGPATTPNKLRHVEYLERLLLSGRLDGARELAVELAKEDDPFVNCLAGYVLLRLGLVDDLGRVAEKVVTAAPQLSDGYVLLGEHAAATGGTTTKQAFNEAVAAGIPMFAEGLTRLLEGLRTNDVDHPRKAIVRYVFQNHMRGCMWSVFTPERFKPGTLVVTAADTGLEA